MKIFEIYGKHFKCLSLLELSRLCNRKSCTLRKLEQLGILPPANIRSATIVVKNGADSGKERAGYRYYSYNLALKIAKVFNEEIHQGVSISEDTKNKLRVLFNEELKEMHHAKNN